MLHLIAKTAERLVPAPIHRALLPLVHKVRHRWRQWRKVELNGCCVIITNPADEVLLLRHSYGPKVWAFPGGGIGKREEPRDAALREMREELGLELETIELVGVMRETISGSTHTAYVFTAMTDQTPKPDQREIVEARFFALDTLPEPLGRVTAPRLALWRDYRSDN